MREERGVRNIVICGKGGIGKSTVTSNVAVLLVREGLRVLQVGCDPKHDSCSRHVEQPIPTVMDAVFRHGSLDVGDIGEMVTRGRTGVACLEAGGPEPGVGCAGRAITLLLEILKDAPAITKGYDVGLYDLLGDVVCGGFAAPIRQGPDTEVYLVVSGETLPIYAANNIARGVVNLSRRGGGRVGGLILNARDVPGEDALVEAFARALGTRVAGRIPRDDAISLSDLEGRTVVEALPDSAAGRAYQDLVRTLLGTTPADLVIPTPLRDEALEALYREHFQRVMRG